MLRRKSRTLIAALAALCMWSGAAWALDCPNPGIHENDTVIKFGTNGSGSAQGVLGTKGSLGGKAQNAGAVYFDYASGELRICDGANWTAVGDPVKSSGTGTFPVDALWTGTISSGSSWTIPFEAEGHYVTSIYITATSSCTLDYRRPNGSWTQIGSIPQDNVFSVGFLIAPTGGSGYRVAQQYWDAYHPPSGPEAQYIENGYLTGWRGINNINWSGRMRVGAGCSGTISVWRTV